MTYVLKTRAPDGALVAPHGIHADYAELHCAIRDAEIFRDVFGCMIYVVLHQPESIVAFV